MKTHFLLVLTVLGLAVLTLLAADFNGAWTAQVPGRGGNMMDYTFNFKVQGDAVTGNVVTQFGDTPISDGKVSGDNISFTQALEFGRNSIKFLYKGTAAGSEIKFTRTRDGGEGRTQEFVAKKK
jgi:hypothetical protein